LMILMQVAYAPCGSTTILPAMWSPTWIFARSACGPTSNGPALTGVAVRCAGGGSIQLQATGLA
jgi:hypothetical protein